MKSTIPPFERQTVRPEMSVRQVATDFPDSKSVFLRYGEPERSDGRFGHLEPLTHFARRQGVAIGTLLAELKKATGATVQISCAYGERIHHGFLLAALAITLSLGTGWGVWMLWSIGSEVRFRAVSAASVAAHGEAQLWGFIVLFIMGISLRTVLQGAVQHPIGPWVCRALLALALLGIAGGFLWFLLPHKVPQLGVASAAALFVMALLYGTMQLTILRHKWRATWARAILASGVWLLVWAGVTMYFRWFADGGGTGAYSSSQ